MHNFYHKSSLFLLLLAVSQPAFSQASKGDHVLKGRVLNRASKLPVVDIQVALPADKLIANTNSDGYFSILHVPAGSHQVIVSGASIKSDTLNINTGDQDQDLGEVLVTVSDQPAADNAEIPTITIEENTAQSDENSSASSESSTAFYVANQDPFLYTASVTFGPYFYRPRGYDNGDVQVNGVQMQDLETGFASNTQISGLNDVLRDRTIVYGLRPSNYSFGTVKGSTYIDATASNEREGGSVSYLGSNGTARHRIMATYSSGVKKGWAYSLSGSRRLSAEGYMPGTFYDGYSFYAGISKVMKKSELHLTALGANVRRGRTTAEIDEVFDLVGTHYFNAAWGTQDGAKRNALTSEVFQPVVIANYSYKPSDKTWWNTAVGYQFGKSRRGNVDFYNSLSPNPTFYKKLPSYYIHGDNTPNYTAVNELRAKYVADPGLLQINWDDFYNANNTNTETVNNVNGVAGNSVTGKRSAYVLRDDVNDMKKFTAKSTINHVVNEHISIDGGGEFTWQYDEYYKELTDLLGGDYFLNYNQFAAQQSIQKFTYRQNDLNTPNRTVKTGEKYGYDFILRAMKATAWTQGVFSYNHIDMFGAVEVNYTSFNREGLYRNGLYPDNSFGTSATHSFVGYRFKGGASYKLSAKHALFANAGYFVDAPKIENVYISDRTRDFIVGDAKPYTTATVEAGYEFRTPKFKARATGYATDVKGNTLIKRFWNDDPDLNSFVNYVMHQVNTRSTGIEFSSVLNVTHNLAVTGVAAVGQSFYTNEPMVSIYNDNSELMTPVERKVYINNYYLGVGPQSIYSLGLRYNPSNWHFRASANYFDRNYVEINPDRRTQMATMMVDTASEQWKAIITQEKLPSAFTVDVSVGRTIDLSKYYKSRRKTSLNINVSVNNLLNNTNIKNVGFEQMRYDFRNYDAMKFPNKYIYAYGLTFYISASLRF